MIRAEKTSGLPDKNTVEAEVKRERYRKRYRVSFRSTVFSLITVAAAAILVATLWMPVLQIYGSSMTPSMEDGDIVISTTATDFNTGDIIAFYYNNKVLVKRVIATSGQWVDMDADGTVYVNGTAIEEPYLAEKSFGDCDIALPYQVPENKIFVMGDHRSVSVDSRNSVVGCVAEDEIVGKIVFRVWPVSGFGILK